MKCLLRGAVIWAEICDKERRSETKERPALVITANDKIAEGRDLIVAVISTKFHNPLPSCWFPIPSGPIDGESTGLDRPSVIKADWVEKIPQSQVKKILSKDPVRASLYKSVINWIKTDMENRRRKT